MKTINKLVQSCRKWKDTHKPNLATAIKSCVTFAKRLLLYSKTIRFRTRNYLKYRAKPKISSVSIAVVAGLAGTTVLSCVRGTLFLSTLPTTESTSLLFSLGTMTVGVLVIIFTLSTIILTNTLDKLPSALYGRFVKDKYIDLIYLVISGLALLFFALGLVAESGTGEYRPHLYRISAVAIIWVLVSIYLFYKRVQHVLNPSYQVIYFARNIKKDIDEIKFLVDKHSELTIGVIKVTPQQQAVVKAGVYSQLNSRIQGIKFDISQLIIMHDKALSSGDMTFAGDCLHTIFAAVGGYLYSRKDMNMAEMSQLVPIPQSDSSKFTQSFSEMVYPIWLKYLELNNQETLKMYLGLFRDLVILTLQVNHANSDYENPTFESALANFERVVKTAVTAKNIDAMFHSPAMFAAIYKECLKHQLSISPLAGILKQLQILLTTAVALHEDAVVSEVISAYKSMAVSASNKYSDYDADEIKKFGTILAIHVASGITASALTDVAFADLAEQLLRLSAGDIGVLPSNEQTNRFIEQSDIMISIAATTYRMSDGMALPGQSFNRPLTVWVSAALDMHANANTTQKAEINRLFDVVIAMLPSFGSGLKDTKDGQRLDDFVDTYAKLGIYAAVAADYELSFKIFSNLISKGMQLIGKRSGDTNTLFAGLRAITKAGYIAVVVAKERPDQMQKFSKLLIQAEKTYVLTLFPEGFQAGRSYSPSPFQVRQSYDDLIGGRSSVGFRGILEYANDTLLTYVNANEIRQFRDIVWPSSSSPIDYFAPATEEGLATIIEAVSFPLGAETQEELKRAKRTHIKKPKKQNKNRKRKN
jgi:hypothetical protein